VTKETAAILDPICRAEIERMRAAPDLALVLDHLAAAGPSAPEDLKVELGLKPKELKGILFPLELCGAVVRRNGTLERWDQAFPDPQGGCGGPEELLVAAVRAAVVAPEKEVGRWFSWRWLFPPELVESLVVDGRLERPEPGWLAAPAYLPGAAPGCTRPRASGTRTGAVGGIGDVPEPEELVDAPDERRRGRRVEVCAVDWTRTRIPSCRSPAAALPRRLPGRSQWRCGARASPLTAAGPFRIRTGFPDRSPVCGPSLSSPPLVEALALDFDAVL